jgi:hypothetical protein
VLKNLAIVAVIGAIIAPILPTGTPLDSLGRAGIALSDTPMASD